MATINTVDDLIEVLRNDDRMRSAVRRELLTEEVLALPERVDKMVEAQSAMQETQTGILGSIQSLQETQTGILGSIRSLQETQTEMLETQTDAGEIQSLQETQTEMLETQTGILGSIQSLTEGQIAATEHRAKLHALHREEHDALHRFRGNYAVDAASRNRFEIAEVFAQLCSVERINVDVLDEAELKTMRDKNMGALNSLGVANKVLSAFPATDLALRVTEMEGGPGLEFYVVVEASYTGTSDDIERAAVRARMLGAITGCKAYAVVAAVKPNRGLESRVIRDAGEYVTSGDGSAAFWYQITDKELEPAPPR